MINKEYKPTFTMHKHIIDDVDLTIQEKMLYVYICRYEEKIQKMGKEKARLFISVAMDINLELLEKYLKKLELVEYIKRID